MSAPERQLHAIPRAGGRFLETGTDSGTLGNIPVIVVLTKYDALIARMKRTLDVNSLDGLSNDAIKNLTKNKAEAELQDICIRPLNKFAGLDIPHAEISNYRETLTRLIQITENCVGQHSAPEAAVMTSIAQRMHPGLKIKASIDTTFNNRNTWDCLYVLHTDIVRVWNFYDPHHVMVILFVVATSAPT
ncbi:hypothetical protein EDD22DRAFT_909867 [Suillus occidentalis]|nr:hypothetical protein EDD22DRAFT_920838 [Suillus occidentalis]KAG1758620.1 hypothetical protein EDD22DRAFT_909867 [Suillus occidentalis]